MTTNSLGFRLVLTSTAWLALALPLAGFLIFKLYRADIQSSFDQRLEKLVNSIAVDALSATDIEPQVPPNRYEPLFEDVHSGWYWQIRAVDDPKSSPAQSPSLAGFLLPLLVEDNISEDQAGQRWFNTRGPLGEGIRIIEIVDTKGHVEGAPRYAVSVAGPLDWLENRTSVFLKRLSIALSLTGLGLVVAAFAQVKIGLLPLRRIEKKLASIRSGNAEKLEGELPDEIKPLQKELNALIQSNQEIIDRARTQVGNLAHALKTPLAVILNEAHQHKNVLGTKLSEQVLLMRDQIARYLERARVGARTTVTGQATEVEPVITPILRALTRIYQDRNIKMELEIKKDLKFKGEKQDLEEMLGNVLDNAFKWAQTKVKITTRKVKEETEDRPIMLQILIEEDGHGIPETERLKLGQRGVRLDETKPGSGLGLSIVTELAALYGGKLELDKSSLGGLAVRLFLPAIS